MIPLALVGMSYREAPSAVRAALAAFDSDASGPSQQLLDAGEITGMVRIESCARVEWLLASERPSWAAELFSAALIGAAENPDHVRPRVRHGAAAVGGLLRVAAGLDSVAQGEHAIGNQVLRAFERAHEAGTVCRSLHVAWRGVGELLNRARRILPQGRTGGVQALVLQRLASVPRDAPIAVFGLGEIGQAMLRALADAGFTAVESFNRASMRAFEGVRAARGHVDRRERRAARLAHVAAGRRKQAGVRSRQPAADSSRRRAGSSRRSTNCWTAMARFCRKRNSPRSKWNAPESRRRSARHCSRRRRATHSRR